MTTSQIIACTITWTAVLAAAILLAKTRRALADLRAERRTFNLPGGGTLTFNRRMSDADVEAFKAMWQRTYKPDAAHPVDVLEEQEHPDV